MNERKKRERYYNVTLIKKEKINDMKKLIDNTNLIGLNLSMKTYQVRTFKSAL